MKKYSIYPFITLIALLLYACGGGGGSDSSSSSSSSTTPASTISLATPPGTTCINVTNADVFGNMKFINPNTSGVTSWGCLIVNKSDNQPVLDGTQSARFELRPGDCGANSTFNDCTTNRSRWELQEANYSATQGQIITLNTNIFIPTQSNLYTSQTLNVDLTQINYIYNLVGGALVSYGSLAALQMNKSGALIIQTYSDLDGSFTRLNSYTVSSSPMNQWINIRYEIKSTASGDGYFKAFVNGTLLVNETGRSTLPSVLASNILRFGIYDVYQAGGKASETQVVYFDGISKQVSNY